MSRTVALLLTLAAVPAHGQDITVTAPGITQVVRAAALTSLAVDTAWITPRGQPRERHVGVSLVRLLTHVGAGMADDAARSFAFIEAGDGYRVVLRFDELRGDGGGGPVLLEPGTGAQAGTWRLVVPGEAHGPRSVRDVVRIDIRMLDTVAHDRLVVLVRHAEKAAEPSPDPPLTAEGQARAAALAEVLAAADIGAIVVTPFERTRATATPLARDRGITPVEVAVESSIEAHVAEVARTVRALPAGQATLVVGHSNTIPKIVTALGGPALDDLCDNQYAVLYVLTVPAAGAARLVTASYGAPDPPLTDCPGMR